MKIRVGKYELGISEKFSSEKEAVSVFMKNFPLATKSKVEEAVKPYIKSKKDADNANRTSGENTESEASDAKSGEASFGKKQSGKDKSG